APAGAAPGGPGSVGPPPLPPGPRQAVAAPPDEAGAKHRRAPGVTPPLRKGKAVARIGERVRGIAAVARVAGKYRPIAQVLSAAAAIRADAAGRAEPRDPDALAYRQSRDFRPQGGDAPDDLVAGHDRKLRVWQFAVDHVQIGPADTAGRDLDENFAGRRSWRWPLAHDERRARFLQRHGAHDPSPVTRKAATSAAAVLFRAARSSRWHWNRGGRGPPRPARPNGPNRRPPTRPYPSSPFPPSARYPHFAGPCW